MVGVPLLIGRGANPICWPFFEDCAAWQLPVGVVNDGLWGYLLLSIVAAVCFLRGQIRAGYALLVLVNVIRVLVMLLDYRLRANQHYMLNWVLLGFLFLPGKRALAHHMLAALYLWAGVLKLDPDWLSGATLYKQDQLWFPAGLVPIACAYVVVLEVVMIWGIYARPGLDLLVRRCATAFVPLHIVGHRGLLVPTSDDVPARHPSSSTQHRAAAKPVPGAMQIYAAALLSSLSERSVCCSSPRVFPGDTAVTGEGRMFALHMFDALIECDASFTYHLADGSDVVEHRNETTKMSHRSRCDPIIYYELARRACSRVGGRIAVVRVADAAPVLDLDVRLRARRASSPRSSTLSIFVISARTCRDTHSGATTTGSRPSEARVRRALAQDIRRETMVAAADSNPTALPMRPRHSDESCVVAKCRLKSPDVHQCSVSPAPFEYQVLPHRDAEREPGDNPYGGK